MGSTGYRLEWMNREGTEGYVFQAPKSCMPLVMRRSVEVLDQIATVNKARGKKRALDLVGLRKLCKAMKTLLNKLRRMYVV